MIVHITRTAVLLHTAYIDIIRTATEFTIRQRFSTTINIYFCLWRKYSLNAHSSYCLSCGYHPMSIESENKNNWISTKWNIKFHFAKQNDLLEEIVWLIRPSYVSAIVLPSLCPAHIHIVTRCSYCLEYEVAELVSRVFSQLPCAV